MAGAFQSNCIQRNAAQVHGGGATPEEQRYVPGHKHSDDRRYSLGQLPRTEEEVRRQRQRIKDEIDPPAKVEKIVAKAAKQAVERAKYTDGLDVFERILQAQEAEEKRLKQALKKQRQTFEAGYMQLLNLEIAALLVQAQILADEEQDEEEQIIALMMEFM
jgi:hypothetical protein